MSGYRDFSFYYDLFNTDADYEKLLSFITDRFHRHGLQAGIVADLGCGTGDLTLMLADSGYDMIAVDASEDMLCVLSEKMGESGVGGILLLQQPLQQLDLYGTIRAAVSTFDTLNHIGPLSELDEVFRRTALFLEVGGLFIFDMNTPYKHEQVLADQVFEFEEEGVFCRWENRYHPAEHATTISISIREQGQPDCLESFTEYSYTEEQIRHLCKTHGLRVLETMDGETFGPLRPDSERFIFVTQKEQLCQNW